MAGRAEYDRELLGRLVPWLDLSAETFFTLGINNTQTIFAINNPALSNRIVTLRRIMGSVSAAVFAQRFFALFKSAGLAAGGTPLVHTPDRTSQPAASVIVLGATAGDGGLATAIVPVAGPRVLRYSDAGTATFGYLDIDIDGIDQSLQPGESFYFQTDLFVTEDSALTVYLTEHIGQG